MTFDNVQFSYFPTFLYCISSILSHVGMQIADKLRWPLWRRNVAAKAFRPFGTVQQRFSLSSLNCPFFWQCSLCLIASLCLRTEFVFAHALVWFRVCVCMGGEQTLRPLHQRRSSRTNFNCNWVELIWMFALENKRIRLLLARTTGDTLRVSLGT